MVAEGDAVIIGADSERRARLRSFIVRWLGGWFKVGESGGLIRNRVSKL